MFGNKSVWVHLLRGALGLLSLFCALVLVERSTWFGLACLPSAIFLLKGCPMCWLVGLGETIVMKVRRLQRLDGAQQARELGRRVVDCCGAQKSE